MKNTILSVALFLCAGQIFSQTYQITVLDGYAEIGQAQPGDTIHIWAKEWGAARTFSTWTGDTAHLERPDEWHTRLIMPAKDVTLIGKTKILPTGTNNPFKFEMMQGYLLEKPVYSYFPAGGLPKLVVFLWHGTGGSAMNWVEKDFEMRQFCNYLIANDIGIIVTESDESTANADLNGDGEIRYEYGGDTLTGRDYVNVRAIRDTFLNRGKITWKTPLAALGFSAGGAFSVSLANKMGWKAGVSHNSPGGAVGQQVSVIYSMSQRDNHPDVGAAGNLEALQKVDSLKSLGRCAEFFFQRPSPTYPERFRRIPSITTAQAFALHNELAINGCLGNGNYFIKSPGEIEAHIIQNPQKWPNVLAQQPLVRDWLKDEIATMWSAHHFHHDFMAADLKFLLEQCGQTISTQTPENVEVVQVFPNPTRDFIFFKNEIQRARVFDLNGRLVLEKSSVGESKLDVSALPSGVYFWEIFTEKNRRQVGRFVKI